MQESLVREGKIHGFCPVDLRPLSPVTVSTPDDVTHTVTRAREAFPAWETLPFNKKVRLLKKAGKRMLERRQEILELICEEVGKPPGEILMSEAVGPLQFIGDWSKLCRPWMKSKKLSISPLAFPGKKGQIDMLPRGVVGIITSWNYPLANFFKPVFPALLCGNTVVLKASEFSPRSTEWFVKIMNEFLPPGVLSHVQGDGAVAQSLIRSGIDALTFTGSFQTGKAACTLAAEMMIPCGVELGGKDAAIVLADCNLDRTVAGIIHWSLHNAGQACGDLERVFIEESIADEFVAKLTRAVLALRVRSGEIQNSDVGPSSHAGQLKIVEEHIQDAVTKGAKLLCGGKRTGKGLWIEPAVLDHCNSTMLVMKEPTFGPVISIARVKNSEEAIRAVNNCDYGLNASVWSGDVRHATAVAKRLEVGTAFVNNHAFTGAIAAAPWTGVKKSGHGIASSIYSLQHYTRPRTVVVDRKKSVDGWWYPMNRDGEELGHCLAEAQLGNLVSAIKIPFLMSRRQSAVMDFVRNGTHQDDDTESNTPYQSTVERLPSFSRRMRATLSKWTSKLSIPISRKEVSWGSAIMFTIYPLGPTSTMPSLTAEQMGDFVRDFYQTIPFLPKLLFRVSIDLVGLCPLLVIGRWKTFDTLPPEEQLEVLETLDKSRFYLLREIVLLFKTTGSFSQLSTSRFQAGVLNVRKSGPAAASTEPKVDRSRGEGPYSDRTQPERPHSEMEV